MLQKIFKHNYYFISIQKQADKNVCSIKLTKWNSLVFVSKVCADASNEVCEVTEALATIVPGTS